MSHHTNPFWGHWFYCFLPGSHCWMGRRGLLSSELLAMALPQSMLLPQLLLFAVLRQLLCSPSMCPQLNPPTLQPFWEKWQNQNSVACHWVGPCSPASWVPGLLTALFRATNVKAWAPPMLNSSSFETDLIFSTHSIKMRRQIKQKSPNTQVLAFRVSSKLNVIWKSGSLRTKQKFHH